jgi:hypothetical protein
MTELSAQPLPVGAGDQPDDQSDQSEQQQVAYQHIYPMQPDKISVKVNADTPKVKAPKPVKEHKEQRYQRARQRA